MVVKSRKPDFRGSLRNGLCVRHQVGWALLPGGSICFPSTLSFSPGAELKPEKSGCRPRSHGDGGPRKELLIPGIADIELIQEALRTPKAQTPGAYRFGRLSHHSFFSRHHPHPQHVTHIQGRGEGRPGPGQWWGRVHGLLNWKGGDPVPVSRLSPREDGHLARIPGLHGYLQALGQDTTQAGAEVGQFQGPPA